jgi:hypothetical protein
MAKKNDKSAPVAEAQKPTQPEQTEQRVVDQEVNHGVTVEHGAPVSEAEATAIEPTQLQPAGSADPTADSTADGAHNDTVNTHPQSPTHKGDLSESDLKAVVTAFNQPGAQVLSIAEKYGITGERVFEIVDDANGVPEENRV